MRPVQHLPISGSPWLSGTVSPVDSGFEVVFKTIVGGMGDVTIPHLVSPGNIVVQ